MLQNNGSNASHLLRYGDPMTLGHIDSIIKTKITVVVVVVVVVVLVVVVEVVVIVVVAA